MFYSNETRFCRWCSTPYQPKKATYRDGFCKGSCKAALSRARKRAEKFAYLGKRKLPGKRSRKTKMRYTKRKGRKKK